MECGYGMPGKLDKESDHSAVLALETDDGCILVYVTLVIPGYQTPVFFTSMWSILITESFHSICEG